MTTDPGLIFLSVQPHELELCATNVHTIVASTQRGALQEKSLTGPQNTVQLDLFAGYSRR